MINKESNAALRTLSEQVDISDVALLVVDVQNDFAHERGKAAGMGMDMDPTHQAVARINRLILAAREARIPVIFLRTEHSHQTDRPNFKARYQLRGFDPEDLLCATGTWGAELYEKLEPPITYEPIVTKFGYDGFQDTALDAVLQNRGVKTLVMTGIVTNLCVQTTAEHGFGLGYGVVIVKDATAGSNPKAHEAALGNLGAFFGPVVESDSLIGLWHESSPS